MQIKRNLRLQLRPYGKNGSIYMIRLRASFNGERLNVSTGCNIHDSSVWDETLQLVKEGYFGPNGTTAADINSSIRNTKEQMELAFRYFEALDIIPTLDQLKAKYNERLNGIKPRKPEKKKAERKEKEPSLFDVFDMFVKENGEKNAWTEATFEKMAAMRNDFLSFRKNLKLADLSESTLTEFVAFLRDDKVLRRPRKAKGERDEYDDEDIHGLKNSTIEKKLGYMKWFLNWATAKGFNTNMAYKTFKPTLKQTQKKVIYFTQEELNILAKMAFSGETAYLEPVRDDFLFCCFTGLRHSDAINLRRNDIKGDHIEITTVKTADSIKIELNSVSKAILDKYSMIEFPGDRALPYLTNQNFNRDLKKLCKLAGFTEAIRITTYKGNERIDEVKEKWELVGSHCGRRTFIVNALSLGIAPNVVMKWTGHNDYKSMKPYIDIVDSIRAAAMTKFNSIIY